MNTRRFLQMAVLFLFCSLDLASAEPPPEPPLIVAAPDPCAWTIDIQHKNPRPAPPSDPKGAGAYQHLMAIYPRQLRETVEKSGKEWHRESIFDDKSQTNIWICKGVEIVQFRNFPPDKVIVSPLSSPHLLVKPAFGDDFPELAWISADTFVGTVVYAGKSCHLYRSKSGKPLSGRDMLAKPPASTEVSAWIDAKTRLPVAIEDQDLLKTYTYRTGPAEIHPTGIFADALNHAVAASKGTNGE